MLLFQRTDTQTNLPYIVLILDHDETFAISDRMPNGEYIIQKDGSINATIMDSHKLQRIVNFAILFQVPIHIVTARADIPGDRKVIESIVKSVDGFRSERGGFKREHIHFASTKIDGIWKQISTKAEIIESIHRKFYPHLRKKDFLFVDDMLKYLEGVDKAGFLTFQANPETKEHFELIEEFILGHGKFYTDKPMLFRKFLNATPAEREELPLGISDDIREEGLSTLKKALNC